MFLIRILSFLIVFIIISSCKNNTMTLSGLDPKDFEITYCNKHIQLYTLKNKNMELCVTNYGGRIVSVVVPDRKGIKRDVVLGFDSIGDYIKFQTSFGATIGRYANRIKLGTFVLDSVEYRLPINNSIHTIHGGYNGFQKKVFDVKSFNDSCLVMHYLSKDGEEGFPGNLDCTVSMKLTHDNTIDISYNAVTDKPTIVNMTNHSFFNLDGNPMMDVGNYTLCIDADYYTPIDSTLVTTGEIIPVDNSIMDFRNEKKINEIFNSNDNQLRYANGLDHNYVINDYGNILRPCAKLFSDKTGILLSVYTNEPGVQVYTANSLNGRFVGKNGIVYNNKSAICIETQHYPDSPNNIKWPSVVLRPGQLYFSRCIYKFSIVDN